uniref:Sugar phosphate transporter domain-containing protein n=1 Tax=Aegilops tauschii subsp. strangulata TaxID=200361 RepID=A0A453QQ63_AEGTS
MPEADVLAAVTAAEVVSPRSGYFRQRSMHAADPDRKAFDVENPPGASVGAAGAGAGGGLGLGLRPSESVAKLESLERAERAALAPAVVLKTGFYILVWYTFSTCLTLYNKTLLGDKLGKFPAPLLMNTVHFALQAALSKIILLFQAKGIDSAVEMSWKDYFMRGDHPPAPRFISRFTSSCSMALCLLMLLALPLCSRPNCSGNRPRH